MTAAASSEESPQWAWFAHHQITFVLAALTAEIASDLTDLDALSWTATALLCAFVAGQFAVVRHTGILCRRCLDRIPTDASVQAERRDWLLRLRHWTWAHPIKIMLAVLVLISIDIATRTDVSPYVVWPWFALEAWAQRFHNQVAPWCKYCRNDGWDPTVTPTPDPSRVKTA